MLNAEATDLQFIHSSVNFLSQTTVVAAIVALKDDHEPAAATAIAGITQP